MATYRLDRGDFAIAGPSSKREHVDTKKLGGLTGSIATFSYLDRFSHTS